MDLEKRIEALKEAQARRHRAWAMRKDGKKLREIAAALNVSIEGARLMVKQAASELPNHDLEANTPEVLKN